MNLGPKVTIRVRIPAPVDPRVQPLESVGVPRDLIARVVLPMLRRSEASG